MYLCKFDQGRYFFDTLYKETLSNRFTNEDKHSCKVARICILLRLRGC